MPPKKTKQTTEDVEKKKATKKGGKKTSKRDESDDDDSEEFDVGASDIALAMGSAADDQSTKPQSRSVNAASTKRGGGKVKKTNEAGDVKEEASRVSLAPRTQRNRSKAAVAVSPSR